MKEILFVLLFGSNCIWNPSDDHVIADNTLRFYTVGNSCEYLGFKTSEDLYKYAKLNSIIGKEHTVYDIQAGKMFEIRQEKITRPNFKIELLEKQNQP